MRRKIFVIGGLLLIAGAAVGIWWSINSSHVPTPTPRQAVTVRLAWLHQAQFAGMYVAKSEGLYDQAGLDVDLKEYEFGIDQLDELVNGRVQFAVASGAEVMAAADKGLPIKAVAAIYQASPFAILSLKDGPISGPADFRGRVLGLEGDSNEARVTYGGLLKAFRLRKEDAVFQPLNFDEVNDLKDHRADTVDAYRTDQPYRFKKAGIGINVIEPERYGLLRYGDTLVTTDAMIAKEPETVRRFVGATLRGWERALEDRVAAVSTVMPYTKGYYRDRAYQEYILDSSAPLIKPSPGFSIGDMRYQRWQESYQMFMENGVFTRNVDAKSCYTPKFLQEWAL